MKTKLNTIFGALIILLIVGSLIIPIFAEGNPGILPYNNTNYNNTYNNSSDQDNKDNSEETNIKIIRTNDKTEDETKVIITEEDKNYFNNELGLNATNEIKESSLRVLVEEKKKDSEKVRSATDIAKTVEEKKREIVSVELVKIEKRFLEDMNKKRESSTTRKQIEEQLDNYIQVIEENKEIEIKIRNTNVKEYFKTKDGDKLINSMIT